jgi:hypothetical protein
MLLHMQIDSNQMSQVFDWLVAADLPERRGVRAWVSLLQAHATLMRRLESDLEQEGLQGCGVRVAADAVLPRLDRR